MRTRSKGARGLRFYRTLLVSIICLCFVATSAVAASDLVTLPSGEQIQIEQTGSTTTITLPSGVTVTRQDYGNTSTWGAAPSVSNSDFEKAQLAYTLWDSSRPRPTERTVPIWFALAAIAISLFNLLAPGAAWYLSDGWKFRDAEPSDLAINMHLIGGAIGLLVGIGLLIFG